MVFKGYRVRFFLRMLLILITSGLLVWFYMKSGLHITPVFISVVLIGQISSLLRFVEKPQRDLNRFFEAIRNSDFTQTFSRRSSNKALAPMFEGFSNVLEAFNKTRLEKESQHRYLETIVQHIGVGLLVFKADGAIDMVNQVARRLLGIRGLKHINDLSKINPDLPETIQNIKPNTKTRLRFQHPGTGDTLSLSVQTTRFIIQNDSYVMASIQNIQSDLEEKELETWQHLIRILTHEITNSITPISSLASTAKSLLNLCREHQNHETLEDVNQAVQTIETRSQGLLTFVESYRQLTHLPHPDFRIIMIEDVFTHIAKLLSGEFSERNVQFRHDISPASLEITADRSLIEQVLINLLRNSLAWCAGRPDASVQLLASLGPNSRPIIQVIDNGPGIQEQAIDHIFIPFFTTRKGGTGIGLSLSRQIMHLHRGAISVTSVPDKETIFTLRF